jgi:hypothetical protein
MVLSLIKMQESLTSIFRKNNINLSSQVDHDKRLLGFQDSDEEAKMSH